MPPKVKITKEEITSAALALVRKGGDSAINARTLAEALGCSTQPIFSNFATMDDLRLATAEAATELFKEYMKREIESGEFPVYKASGMAYIKFAKEEKALFKFLYMCDRSGGDIPDDDSLNNQMVGIVHDNTGLEGEKSELFHLEMWAFVHGIATMFATGFLDLDLALVSKMITDAYQGLRKQYGTE